MSSQSESETDTGLVSEAEVEAYLRAHPDFFERHIALLDVLKLPHRTGGAVSLVERQLGLLREKNHQLERKLMDLVQVARDNEQLSARLHRLALALMDADGLDSVVASARDQFRSEFHADHVVLRLIAREPNERADYFMPADTHELELFAKLFETQRPICGRLGQRQREALFGDEAEAVVSAVLLPLSEGQPLGLLALGSREAGRFHPGMGTLFLGYLAELISRAVALRRAT
jgi:uncharacterized protein YigA (DUF484 family)